MRFHSNDATATLPSPLTGTYRNPILDADFPDPAVILAGDGHYYAYATQTLRDGEWINIQVARSADLVHWHHLGDAHAAQAGLGAETQDFWAPYCFAHGDRYLMYYSATPDVCDVPERGHCLAIATASSPAGPFVDIGMPLLLGMGFEYIDPMVLNDPETGGTFSTGDRASSRSGSRNWPRTTCRSRPTASRLSSSGQTQSRAPSRAWSRLPG